MPSLWKTISIFVVAVLAGLGIGGYFFYTQYLVKRQAFQAYSTGNDEIVAGNWDAAIEAYEQAFRLHPEHPEYGYELFDHIYWLRPEAAEALIEKIEPLAVNQGRTLSRKILLALEAGDAGKAQTLVNLLEAYEPLGVDGRLIQGLVLAAAGEVGQGYAALDTLRDEFPDDRRVRYWMAAIAGLVEDPVLLASAKQGLMNLIQPYDVLSVRALLDLAQNPRYPLFPNDWETITDAMDTHPLFRRALDRAQATVLRNTSRQLLSRDPELAYRVTEVLLARDEATVEDRVFQAENAMNLNRPEASRRILAGFDEAFTETPEYALLQVKQELIEGEREAALDRMEALLEAAPETEALLRLAFGLLAENRFGFTISEQNRLADLIIRHPSGGLGVQLLAFQRKIELDPLDKDSLLREAISRYAEDNPVQLTQWLNSLEAANFSLEIVSEAEALESYDLFRTRLAALLQQDAIDAAEALLDKAGDLVPPIDTQLFRTEISLRREAWDRARENWEIAYDLVYPTSRNELFLLLASLAGQMDDQDAALRAFDEAFDRRINIPILQGLTYMGLLMEADRMEDAAQLSAAMLKRYPNVPVLVNNEVYVNLLLGEEPLTELARMKEVVATQPDVSQFQVTHALAQLLAGETSLALETIEDVEIDFTEAGARSQYVLALVNAANGRLAFAQSLLSNIDLESLTTPERALLSRLVDGYN